MDRRKLKLDETPLKESLKNSQDVMKTCGHIDKPVGALPKKTIETSQLLESLSQQSNSKTKCWYANQPAEKDFGNIRPYEDNPWTGSRSSIEQKNDVDKLTERLAQEYFSATTRPNKEFTVKDPSRSTKPQFEESKNSPVDLFYRRYQNTSFDLRNAGVSRNVCFNVTQNEFSKNQLLERQMRAATLIQAAFRGYIARKFVKLLKLRVKTIQKNPSVQKIVKTKGVSFQGNSFNQQNFRISFQPPSILSKSSPNFKKNIQTDDYRSCKKNLNNKSLIMLSTRNYLEKGSLFFEHEESVLVFGGLDPHRSYGAKGNTGKDAFRYHPEKNVWDFITELPEPRHHHSVAFLKGRIYIVGGTDPRNSDRATTPKIVSTVWSFEPVTRAWHLETSMKIARKNFGLVPMGGRLYVIGGQDKYQRILTNVERFDPATGKWEEMASLEIGRMGVAAAKYRDVIWVCGGVICAKKSTLCDRVDCYDTQRNLWIQCTPLRFPRCFGVLFPMNDLLYLIGGAGRQSAKETTTYSIGAIDVWDAKKKEWRLENKMAIPRHGHSVCYLGSQLVILGGVTTSCMCALDNVESWCSRSNVWIRGLANLPSALSGHGSVTLPPASLL